MIEKIPSWYSLPAWGKWLSIVVSLWAALAPIAIVGMFIMKSVIHNTVEDSLTPIYKELKEQENRWKDQNIFNFQMRGAFNHYHQDANRFFTRGGNVAQRYRPYNQFNCLLENEIIRETRDLR